MYIIYLLSTGQLNVPKLPRYALDFISKNKGSWVNLPVIMHSAEFDRSVPLNGKVCDVLHTFILLYMYMHICMYVCIQTDHRHHREWRDWCTDGWSSAAYCWQANPVPGNIKRFLIFLYIYVPNIFLYVIKRSPKWVLAKPFIKVNRYILGALQSLPFNIGNLFMRCVSFILLELLHLIVSKIGFFQRLFASYLEWDILAANPRARDMNCVPTFRPGCSRIIVHAGYPSTLIKSNVSLYSTNYYSHKYRII